LMALSFVACILSFKFTRKMYQSYWSPFGIKLGTFFSAELFVSMTFVPYFIITEQFMIFPYYVIVIVLLLSTAIGTWLSKLETLRSLLRQRAEALE
jgi:VIT1/CCC1 family predicted Fe2+/Mn2+ transporter